MVSGMLAADLAVIPQIGVHMTTPAAAFAVVGAGALAGAAVSSWMNRGPRRVKTRREAILREDRAAARARAPRDRVLAGAREGPLAGALS